MISIYDLDDENIKIFRVVGGYDNSPERQRTDYVYATTKKQAKQKYKKRFTWLKVYEIEEVEAAMADMIQKAALTTQGRLDGMSLSLF